MLAADIFEIRGENSAVFSLWAGPGHLSRGACSLRVSPGNTTVRNLLCKYLHDTFLLRELQVISPWPLAGHRGGTSHRYPPDNTHRSKHICASTHNTARFGVTMEALFPSQSSNVVVERVFVDRWPFLQLAFP
jgi:hypothetical protein